MIDRKYLRLVSCLIAGFGLIAMPAAAITGSVTDRDGNPIEGVLVITSGKGVGGWTNSSADGSFRLPAAGQFVSFRHAKYKPLLVRSSELIDPVRVKLIPADETVLKLRPCASMRGRREDWIGGGLRVNAGGKHEGPEQGEHDSHWYVRHGNNKLHVVDGPFWHAGLPLEQTLTRSESINVRGWVFGETVGLDLSGRTRDGRYWRWVGAPLVDAIEYETDNRDTADYFDTIIATVCASYAQ